jgi:glycosyltransferase involved in cell wall biosynthesis
VKVAHVVMGGEVAGGQLVALQLLRALRAAGGEVLVVSPSRGAFTELVEAEGGTVHILDLTRTFHLGALFAFARVVRRERVDVVHTHGQIAMNALARAGGRLGGAAVVSHMHIANHFRPGRAARSLHIALDNATARLCARILCVSEDTRRVFERQGYPARRMETVHNGINLESVPRAADGVRASLGIPEDVQLVGEIARLCDVKGQRELVEAFARLPRPEAFLVLVGRDLEQDGRFEDALRRRAEELGVADRVIFAGYRSDPHAVLESLDVLALPSSSEGLPLVVLEALAHAKPVVVTPVGGTPELVRDGETGLLVPPCDAAALAAALDRVLGDPALAHRLGQAGREHVGRNFSERALCERVLAVYDEVVG